MSDIHEPKNSLVIIYGLVASFLLVVIVLTLLFYFDRAKYGQIHAKVELAPNTELRKLRVYEEEQLGLNGRYTYANREQGVVRIPLDRALQLEAEGSWRLNARLSGEQPATAPDQGATPPAAPQPNDGGTTHALPAAASAAPTTATAPAGP